MRRSLMPCNIGTKAVSNTAQGTKARNAPQMPPPKAKRQRHRHTGRRRRSETERSTGRKTEKAHRHTGRRRSSLLPPPFLIWNAAHRPHRNAAHRPPPDAAADATGHRRNAQTPPQATGRTQNAAAPFVCAFLILCRSTGTQAAAAKRAAA